MSSPPLSSRVSSFRLAALVVALGGGLGACGGGEESGPAPAAAVPEEVPAATKAALPVAQAPLPEPAYDHLVLVTFDTLRADHVTSYGYSRETTPFLDELARSGVLFSNVVSSVSHTAPSHATMLTGLPPRVHGVRTNGNRLKNTAASLPALLRTRGFTSAAFLGAGFLKAISGGFDTVKIGRGAPDLVDGAIEWAREQGDKPWFLWLHLYEPHKWKRPKFPAWAREEVTASWTGGSQSVYDYIAGLHGFPAITPGGPFDLPWAGGDGMGREHRPDSAEEVETFIDSYDGLIRFADFHVRRLFEAIEPEAAGRHGLWILTADHGEGLGSHGYEGHGGLIYNEQLRVPLVFHATDDSLPARRVSELVAHLDFLPTLAELMGFPWSPPNTEFFGRSLVPLLRGQGAGFPERLIFSEQHPSPGETVRGRELLSVQDLHHKLILRPDGDAELYDLRMDPLELNGLGAEHPLQAELRAALEQRLRFYGTLAGEDSVEEPDPEFLDELKDLGYAR